MHPTYETTQDDVIDSRHWCLWPSVGQQPTNSTLNQTVDQPRTIMPTRPWPSGIASDASWLRHRLIRRPAVSARSCCKALHAAEILSVCLSVTLILTALSYSFACQINLLTLTLMYKMQYIAWSASRPRLHLRSSSSIDYMLPRLRTELGERAFSYSGRDCLKTFAQNLASQTFGSFCVQCSITVFLPVYILCNAPVALL